MLRDFFAIAFIRLLDVIGWLASVTTAPRLIVVLLVALLWVAVRVSRAVLPR